MKMIIPSSTIKYIKICIISPLFENISNLIYLVSFILLSIALIEPKKTITNYKKNSLIARQFEEEKFRTITTDEEFLNYLDLLVPKIYNYSPLNGVPISIPFGNIRLQKYGNKPEYCSHKIDFSYACNDFICTINTLNDLYKKSYCGYPNTKKYYKVYSEKEIPPSKFKKLVRRFEGRYSTYNLITEGINIDFNINDYESKKKEIEAFVKDYDLKFITIQINLYFPTEDDYALILMGVEMINYFLHPYTIFTSTIYGLFNLRDSYFIVCYVVFGISVCLILIRFIYEVAINFKFDIHPFIFINLVADLLLIIFLSLYFYASNEEDFFHETYQLQVFHQHYISISIKSYCIIILSVLFLFIPFRFISIISWIEEGTTSIVRYFIVIFRVMPIGLIIFFITIMLYFMFGVMNFFMFNSKFFIMKNLFLSVCSAFNLGLTNTMNQSQLLDYSISDSKYGLLFIVLELMTTIYLLVLITSTVTVLIKRGIKKDEEEKEEEEAEDEVMQKIKEIEDKYQTVQSDSGNEKEEEEREDLMDGPKTILWLGLNPKKFIYETLKSKNPGILFFQNSVKIISFIKYLFSIKPLMQYQNLADKIDIVVESCAEKKYLKEKDITEINELIEWLSFSGCKIDILLYTQSKIARDLLMRLAASYGSFRVTTFLGDLEEFVSPQKEDEVDGTGEEEDDFGFSVIQVQSFMIYASKFISEFGCNNNISYLSGDESKKTDNLFNLNTTRSKDLRLQLKGLSRRESLKNPNNLSCFSTNNNNAQNRVLKRMLTVDSSSLKKPEDHTKNFLKSNTFFKLKTVERQPSLLSKISQTITEEEKSKGDE